jgi:hypothetical protein
MAEDLIPVQTEPFIPEDWNYDQSVTKCWNLFKMVREKGAEALTELLIAHKVLTEDSKKKVGRKWPGKTFTGYCKDIGITDETAYNWFRKYCPAYSSQLGMCSASGGAVSCKQRGVRLE